MNVALDQHFPHFYETNRYFLWLATLGLSLPLLLRAVINLLYMESASFETFFENEFVIANNTFLICSTYLPIFTSMFSLIFGYLRKRQEKMASNDQIGGEIVTVHGGSGELVGNAHDDKTSYMSSAMASDLKSYLDPPIENYRSIYSGKIKVSNGSKIDVLSPHNSNSNYNTSKK